MRPANLDHAPMEQVMSRNTWPEHRLDIQPDAPHPARQCSRGALPDAAAPHAPAPGGHADELYHDAEICSPAPEEAARGAGPPPRQASMQVGRQSK